MNAFDPIYEASKAVGVFVRWDRHQLNFAPMGSPEDCQRFYAALWDRLWLLWKVERPCIAPPTNAPNQPLAQFQTWWTAGQVAMLAAPTHAVFYPEKALQISDEIAAQGWQGSPMFRFAGCCNDWRIADGHHRAAALRLGIHCGTIPPETPVPVVALTKETVLELLRNPVIPLDPHFSELVDLYDPRVFNVRPLNPYRHELKAVQIC